MQPAIVADVQEDIGYIIHTEVLEASLQVTILSATFCSRGTEGTHSIAAGVKP